MRAAAGPRLWEPLSSRLVTNGESAAPSVPPRVETNQKQENRLMPMLAQVV